MDIFFEKIGLRALERQFQGTAQPTVSNGPFRGLHYLRRAAGSVWFPKVIGSYELELHPVVEELVSLAPDLLVDIGAAEGYYAAGFAMRLPDAKIIAADTNPLARRRIRRLCHINRSRHRVTVMGLVIPGRLNTLLEGYTHPAVWCDIEGAEFALLHPERCANLAKTWICFESHEANVDWSIEEIVSRFTGTHTVEKIPQRERTIADFKEYAGPTSVTGSEALLLISELRSNSQEWVVLRPKNRIE